MLRCWQPRCRPIRLGYVKTRAILTEGGLISEGKWNAIWKDEMLKTQLLCVSSGRRKIITSLSVYCVEITFGLCSRRCKWFAAAYRPQPHRRACNVGNMKDTIDRSCADIYRHKVQQLPLSITKLVPGNINTVTLMILHSGIQSRLWPSQ